MLIALPLLSPGLRICTACCQGRLPPCCRCSCWPIPFLFTFAAVPHVCHPQLLPQPPAHLCHCGGSLRLQQAVEATDIRLLQLLLCSWREALRPLVCNPLCINQHLLQQLLLPSCISCFCGEGVVWQLQLVCWLGQLHVFRRRHVDVPLLLLSLLWLLQQLLLLLPQVLLLLQQLLLPLLLLVLPLLLLLSRWQDGWRWLHHHILLLLR